MTGNPYYFHEEWKVGTPNGLHTKQQLTWAKPRDIVALLYAGTLLRAHYSP